jgi:AcrR family transcriptional regulator
MSDKSLEKRKLILRTAREVFAQKGYKDVTMKDIVEACEISRGGLYLYFDSTSQLFREVLRMESEDTAEDDVFQNAISEKMTSADILALFLKEQKKELLKKKGQLTLAIYEYYFTEPVPKKDNVLRKQFDAAVRIIEKLIADGVESGEFVCDDPRGAARNIMYVLEGLKITGQTIGVTEEMINHEILYVMRGLVAEDE